MGRWLTLNQPLQPSAVPTLALRGLVHRGPRRLNLSVLKRFFAFQNSQHLLGYRPTSELRSFVLR